VQLLPKGAGTQGIPDWIDICPWVYIQGRCYAISSLGLHGIMGLVIDPNALVTLEMHPDHSV
jgi:hypothetical protein